MRAVLIFVLFAVATSLPSPLMRLAQPHAGLDRIEDDQFSVTHPRSVNPILRRTILKNSTSEPLEATPTEEICNTNSDCSRTSFCDEHYWLCRPLQNAGETCRGDRHCIHGFDCMFGRCLPTIANGLKGSRCNPTDSKSCSPGHCCARKHGEWICKARLRKGHHCYVPDGGLAYTLNERCPCQEGLVCTRTSGREHSKNLSWLRAWNHQRSFRCMES